MARYTVILALVAFVLIVGAQAAGYNKDGTKCECFCHRARFIICGKNSKGEFKLFGNPCEMECHSCLKKDYYAATDLSNCPDRTRV